MRRGSARQPSLLPNYVVLIGLALLAIGPLIIIGFNSVKTLPEMGSNPLGPPADPVWANFPAAWEKGHFSVGIRNSFLIVAATVAAELLLAGLASYALARLRVRGEGLLILYLLAVSSLPLQLFLVPLFYLWRSLGLVNNLLGAIIIFVALQAPFAIFLLRSFMVQIPRDFDEAARVDGASDWQVFRFVTVRLSWPGFLTVGLVVGLSVWNDFLIPTVFLTDPSVYTVTTGYLAFTTRFSMNWPLLSAGSVIMILPLVVVFMLFQRRFVEGLSSAGLKG